MTNDFFKMTTEEKMAVYGWTREQVPVMEAQIRELMKPNANDSAYQWKLRKYLDKVVKIVLNNGKILQEHIVDISDPDDNDFGEEGLLFSRNGCLVEIFEHEIESIEIVESDKNGNSSTMQPNPSET